jgi:alanine racemase
MHEHHNLLRTWVEINKDVFVGNIQALKRAIGPSQLGIVVKGNAYGHGMGLIASWAQENPLVDWLFTASTQEACKLRTQGITKPLCAMTYYDTPYEQAIAADIDCVCYSLDMLHALNQAAANLGKIARIHLKIDTGMTRLGIERHEIIPFIEALKKISSCRLVGVMSHLSDVDNPDQSFTLQQLRTFDDAVAFIQPHFEYPLMTHICSSGALRYAHRYSCARVGIATYGLGDFHDAQVQPILQWKTRIIQIKEVPAGRDVGYGRTYTTHKTQKIAVIPVGYVDGYSRALSNKSHLIIHGQAAPLIGRVNMNVCMVDVSHIPSVFVGDEAILISDSHFHASAKILASCAHAIVYTVVSCIDGSIERMTVGNGLSENI